MGAHPHTVPFGGWQPGRKAPGGRRALGPDRIGRRPHSLGEGISGALTRSQCMNDFWSWSRPQDGSAMGSGARRIGSDPEQSAAGRSIWKGEFGIGICIIHWTFARDLPLRLDSGIGGRCSNGIALEGASQKWRSSGPMGTDDGDWPERLSLRRSSSFASRLASMGRSHRRDADHLLVIASWFVRRA